MGIFRQFLTVICPQYNNGGVLLSFHVSVYIPYIIAPDKVLGKHFLISPQKHIGEALLMSTHSICFHGEIENYQYFFVEKKSALSGAVTLGTGASLEHVPIIRANKRSFKVNWKVVCV